MVKILLRLKSKAQVVVASLFVSVLFVTLASAAESPSQQLTSVQYTAPLRDIGNVEDFLFGNSIVTIILERGERVADNAYYFSPEGLLFSPYAAAMPARFIDSGFCFYPQCFHLALDANNKLFAISDSLSTVFEVYYEKGEGEVYRLARDELRAMVNANNAAKERQRMAGFANLGALMTSLQQDLYRKCLERQRGTCLRWSE